jgi:hypothetical protein
VQLMNDSVSSGYSGFCIDNYSKVIIKDSCWSACCHRVGGGRDICLVYLFYTLYDPFVIPYCLSTQLYSRTEGDLKISIWSLQLLWQVKGNVASHSHSCEDDGRILCEWHSQGYHYTPCQVCFTLAGMDTMVFL